MVSRSFSINCIRENSWNILANHPKNSEKARGETRTGGRWRAVILGELGYLGVINISLLIGDSEGTPESSKSPGVDSDEWYVMLDFVWVHVLGGNPCMTFLLKGSLFNHPKMVTKNSQEWIVCFFCVAGFSFRRYTVRTLFWGWMTLQLIVLMVDGFWNYVLFGRLFVLRKKRVCVCVLFFFRTCEWYDYTTTMVHGSEILWLHRLVYETWCKTWGRFSILWVPSAKTTSFLGGFKSRSFFGSL